MLLASREYRTARHLALMGTHISRRATAVDRRDLSAEMGSKEVIQSLFNNSNQLETSPARSPIKLKHTTPNLIGPK